MKLTITLVVCLAVSLPLVAQDKARLKAISDTFSKIEENHEIWNNYSTVVQNAAPVMTTIHHLWISDGEGEEKLSKLETHSLEDHGESKQQFYFKGDQLIFTLDRTENVLIDPNVTDVTEKRYHFADGQLIRVLNKQGRFPAGQPTETDALKSQAVPLSEIENASETYTLQHEMTAPVIQKLLRLAEDGASSSVVRQTDCNLSRVLRARVTLARMSLADAVQMKGLGLRLCTSMCSSMAWIKSSTL